jgi:predicted NBD/HSP70 family sugar kinase
VPGSDTQSVAYDTHPPDTSSRERDFVLGIDFGGTKMAIATADLNGDLLESARLDTEAARGATQAVDRAVASARDLVAVTQRSRRGRCLAVGAVSPGIVYPHRVALAPNVPGWEDLRLPELLVQGLGAARSEFATDVKAAALAEVRWGSLRDADPAILVILGTGLAAAIVVGGEVLQGANGAAGEIGYSLRGVEHELSAADGRAPLEELAGGRAIGERASAVLGGALTAADVFAHPDPRARRVIDEALAELAVHVANMAIVVDPARIAVGGGLMSHRDVVLAALDERLRAAVPFPPELVPARFIHDGSLRGAIALALDAAAVVAHPEEEQ